MPRTDHDPTIEPAPTIADALAGASREHRGPNEWTFEPRRFYPANPAGYAVAVADADDLAARLVDADPEGHLARPAAAAPFTCEGYNIRGRWVDCYRPDIHAHGISADMDPAELLPFGPCEVCGHLAAHHRGTCATCAPTVTPNGGPCRR